MFTFTTVLGKRCSGLAFTSCGAIVETPSDRCERCESPMIEVSGLDRKLILKLSTTTLLAILVVSGLVIIASSTSGVPVHDVTTKPTGPSETRSPPSDNANRNAITRLLQQIYSDGVKTVEEEAKINQQMAGFGVDAEWLVSQEQAIKNRVTQASPFAKRGLMYANRGDYDLAIGELKRSLELYDGNSVAWANLAAAYIKLNDLASAASACDKALLIDSGNWLAHYNRGAIQAVKGNRDSAVSELSEALRLIQSDRAQLVTTRQVGDLMRSDESLEPLRSDPRFQQLVARNH